MHMCLQQFIDTRFRAWDGGGGEWEKKKLN